MKLGIFLKTFNRNSLEECLDAVTTDGLNLIQFNMSCIGMSSMPEEIDLEKALRVNRESSKRNIDISAVSGTFNMAHPDPLVRKKGLEYLRNLAAMCNTMGTSVITLCTGTRDPYDKWKWHPENESKEAWNDLTETMYEALLIANEYKVTLGIEPELSNIVNNAKRGRDILDLMQSDRLKIVIDAANLVHPAKVHEMKATIYEAFELLGDDIILAHAKDLSFEENLTFLAPGEGILDYDYYLSLLNESSFTGPLIMHGLDEVQVSKSITFLNNKLAR